MRALGLDFESRELAEAELPEPSSPGRGQVLFRVRECGVCATDRELAHFRFAEPPPGERFLALGHEALGEVVEVGACVSGFRGGDLIVPMIRRPCAPACVSCRAHRRDMCLTGNYFERGIVRSHGYLAPIAVDPSEDLVPIPPALAGVAVLVEPMSVVQKAIERALQVALLARSPAVVFGAGPVGLLTALALQVRGIDAELVSLEANDSPRALLARRLGLQYRSGHPSRPAKIAFEAAGAAAATRAALSSLSVGGALVLIGATDLEGTFPGVRMVVENLTVTGVVNAGPGHFGSAVRDLQAIGVDRLGWLIERRPVSAWRETVLSPGPSPKVVLCRAD